MNSSSSNGKPKRPPTKWIEEIFARLEKPLVAYVRSRVRGDIEEARDVVQEAFVRLCQQQWPDIEPHATAWLYRTCRNRAIDITRREGRMSTIRSGTDVSTLHDPDFQSPDQHLVQDEQASELRSQLSNLPDKQQELLRLRLRDGLSYKQIADVTGLTVTNVGYHLHQAISSLRVRMQAES